MFSRVTKRYNLRKRGGTREQSASKVSSYLHIFSTKFRIDALFSQVYEQGEAAKSMSVYGGFRELEWKTQRDETLQVPTSFVNPVLNALSGANGKLFEHLAARRHQMASILVGLESVRLLLMGWSLGPIASLGSDRVCCDSSPDFNFPWRVFHLTSLHPPLFFIDFRWWTLFVNGGARSLNWEFDLKSLNKTQLCTPFLVPLKCTLISLFFLYWKHFVTRKNILPHPVFPIEITLSDPLLVQCSKSSRLK